MDLFATASDNIGRLETKVDHMLATIPDHMRSRVAEFSAEVREADVSVNMRISGIIGFLIAGELRTWFENAQDVATLIGDDAEAVLRTQLGDWYPRRVAFEETCTAGQHVHYGALNIGGAGPKIYGDYAVILVATALARHGLAYIRHDSLTYVETSGRVHESRLSEDLASERGKHLLAVLKHTSDLNADTPQWPQTVCSSGAYIEAVFARGDVIDFVRVIRIDQERHKLMRDLIIDNFRRDLTADEKGFVDDCVTLAVSLKHRGLAIEVSDAY